MDTTRFALSPGGSKLRGARSREDFREDVATYRATDVLAFFDELFGGRARDGGPGGGIAWQGHAWVWRADGRRIVVGFDAVDRVEDAVWISSPLEIVGASLDDVLSLWDRIRARLPAVWMYDTENERFYAPEAFGSKFRRL